MAQDFKETREASFVWKVYSIRKCTHWTDAEAWTGEGEEGGRQGHCLSRDGGRGTGGGGRGVGSAWEREEPAGV